MKITSIFLLTLCIITGIQSQDSVRNENVKIEISGFLDVFYIYDFNKLKGSGRQPFLFNHNRHNEFNLNLGYIKANINHSSYRGNLALHTGTYVNDNYASEPGLLKNIFEANIGVALNSKRNIWIDVGVFPSHIGFETAISADNWTLTRSLLAENSPYFLSGAKLSYLIDDNWTVLALVCNGWQRIKRAEGNGLLSFGTQIFYKPSERFNINWSSFIGTDDPDVQRRMRYFNNVYAQLLFSQNLGLIAGFDFGIQQKQFKSADYNKWWSPVIIFQYKINSFWNTASRAEYYHDESGIIIPAISQNGFKTFGLSYNLDYLPAPNLMWRCEIRYLKSPEKIFENATGFTHQNVIIATSLALKF